MSDFDRYIQALETIVNDTIEQLDSGKMNYINNSILILTPSVNYTNNVNERLDNLYNQIVIKMIEHNINLPRINLMRKLFFDLSSYVKFWRFGEDLSEKKWKADYKSEIREIFGTISKLNS